MSIDREDLLLAYRALKRGHLAAGDLRKAFRRQNGLPVRKPLLEVLRSELRISEDVLGPVRAETGHPDPRADRPLLDEIARILEAENLLTPGEFERLASRIVAAPAAAQHPPLEVPQLLGEYEVRWEMGRGGHAVVFRGWHPKHGDVALKIFRPGKVPAGFSARRSEAHPGLVRVHDVVEASGFTALVTELVEGQPFSKLLAAKKLATREALAVAEKAARTLADLHEKGFTHGSLKSSDLLVSKSDVRIKDQGGLPGTPEGDLRAFAEILYEAATGVPPYGPGESREAPPLGAAAVNKMLDPSADRIVSAAIAGQYPTMRALADDLGRFLKGEAVTARKVAPPRSRKSLAAGIAALLAIALAVGIVLAIARRGEEPKKEEAKKEEPKKEEPKKEETKEEEPKNEGPNKEEVKKEEVSEGPMTAHEMLEIEKACLQASTTDVEEMGRLAQMAVRRGPRTAWACYYSARYLYAKGRFAEAMPLIDEAVGMRPDAVEYVEWRFRTLLQRGEFSKAMEVLKNRFGRNWSAINQQIRNLDNHIAANDRDGALYLERGAFWAYRGDESRAVREYGAAIERGTLVALHFRAHARAVQREDRDALEDLDRYVAECPTAGGKEDAAALRKEVEKRLKPR